MSKKNEFLDKLKGYKVSIKFVLKEMLNGIKEIYNTNTGIGKCCFVFSIIFYLTIIVSLRNCYKYTNALEKQNEIQKELVKKL